MGRLVRFLSQKPSCICLCSQVGKVRLIGQVPCQAKQGPDPTINKLYLSQKWQGQSDFIIIHAVHADRALLPSKP